MKKLLSILFLVVIFSCQKEAQYCWTCQIKTTTTFTGGRSEMIAPQTKCNMSTREMELYCQPTTSGNTTTTKTCSKQK